MNRDFFKWSIRFMVMSFVLMLASVFGSSAFALSSSFILQLPENENAILVEKKTQTLSLYANRGRTDSIELVFETSCSTGEVDGVKLQAGDKKTPEGIYFLTDAYEDRYLSPIYGKKAFPIDYPNFIDKRAGKNGSAIWIHGTNKPLRPMDSNGCIALENDSVVKLSEYITLNSTPLIIVNTVDIAGQAVMPDDTKDRLNQLVGDWAENLMQGTYHRFLSLYSSRYLPDIGFWEDWMQVREELKKAADTVKIETDRLGLYYDGDMIVALFDHYLRVNTERLFLGKRKFFIFLENGEFKLMGDVEQITPETSGKVPLLAVSETYLKPESQKEKAVDTIRQWMRAWSKKDMDAYARFYSDRFYSDGMNKKQWVARKKRLSRQYAYIHVKGKNFEAAQNKNTCIVDFFQIYESSGFNTNGKKRLTLINEDGSWKIYRESWKGK